MKQDLAALEEENKKLSKLANHDWLTSIYNRGATETKINQLLSEKRQVSFSYWTWITLNRSTTDMVILPVIVFSRRSSES
ncbi:GGDEF domain protein [Hungatella hathewayi]|uniref:GGDEF domain protein n=1 Tax=Hungatella hathewayi TaxID=154046 RepID=UPI00033D88F3|nr:GGDEF domain protein [Hungatella hathewayi]CCZ62081.1 gGDEF domain protein [Hungatella hathewayi CAG:224]